MLLVYLWWSLGIVGGILFILWLTTRYIPNDKVGIVEKLWSNRGSLGDGEIVALAGEAGFQLMSYAVAFTLATGAGSMRSTNAA